MPWRCGVGTWLSVFGELGIRDLMGLDGEYVDRTQLYVPQGQFLAYDLSAPIELGRRFDLVVSCEVAEHLPPECSAQFVTSLTRLSPAVLFSAACPAPEGS